jgi:glycosyltransferase involved in cell wall biosynthesis
VRELIARRVDHYVCVSNTAARSFEAFYHRTPVVQSPGIDVRRFSPAAARNHQPALLFVGDASDPSNNLALLLEAVAMLRWRRPDIELWIAGAGAGHADRLVGEAPPAAKEGTTLLGDIDGDALADVYPKAWVTVLPAEHVAFGLPLVESLASGTPIVALDRGGPAEVVEQGVGLVCRPTAAGLAAACEEAVELAGSAEVAADCRAAAWTWDWRTAIVPRLLRLYHHQLGSPTG